MPEKFPTIEQPKPDTEILPEDFFEILKTRDDEKIKSLRKSMIAENPENIEIIEAIFWLFTSIRSRKIAIRDKNKCSAEELEEIKKEIFSSTEKQFLLTQFIYSNKENRELLADFWDIGEDIARAVGRRRGLEDLKRGLLGQTAAWHLLKNIGKRPQLSHPDEDAQYSIDLWGDEKMAVQVKSGDKTHLRRVDKVNFPALSYRDGETENLVFAQKYNPGTIDAFVVNLEKYKELKGRDIEGYWLNVGKEERDDITGMPTEEVVERIKKEFEKIEKK
jgi:hypothetical protein